MKKSKKLNNAFDLDKAITEWCQQMKRSGALEDGAIAELEAHLRDEVDDLIEQGKSPESAFHEVTASVESGEKVGHEYHKTYARGLFVAPSHWFGGLSPALFLNSIKVSLRKMRRQKWYSLISVTGLAVGIACSILILLWVRHELSFDRFHKSAENVYRVIMEDNLNEDVSVHPWLPFPLGPALKNKFPEIAEVSRYRPDDMVVRYREKSYTEMEFLTVDPSFFKIFSFPFLQGNSTEALADPHSIVIRDTMVEKYFGSEDPIGKVLNLSGRADLAVSGVVHIPDESDFQFDFFFSFQSYPLFNVDLAPLKANWSGKNYQIYILLQEGSSATNLEKKMTGFLKVRTPLQTEVLGLQKLSAIHLFKPDGSDGAMRYVRIFSLIAAFILLIACVNFMNLATARFEGRAKEVALRKTLGGTRKQLIRQFFTESIIHCGLALAAALLLVELALPTFNQITARQLSLDFSHADLAIGLLAIVLLAGFISGLYPALFLSSFAPARISKAFSHSHGHGSLFRKVLVVFQFALSTMLIIGTLVVKSQISFIMNRDPGMARENIVYHLMQKKTRDSVEVVREELQKHPDIQSIASCSSLPSNIQSWIGYLDWEGRSAEQQVYPAFMSIDHDFVSTAGLTVIEGRDFSKSRPVDAENFIINETALRQIGIENPIGLELRFWYHKGQVIGVVKDFANRHMSSTTAPMILSAGNWGANRNYLLLRLRPGNPSSALKHFRQVWEKANPGFPCEYEFLDEAFNRMYTNEARLSRILFSFAILAIIISCLGLIGLSSYTAEDKTKEIGIRKVLGASPWRIISLFSMNFAKLVIIANAIAWPTAFVVMQRWLQDYAYRATIGIWVFVLAGGLGLFITLGSVGYQTLRAATANPVDSLRYE
ncbi:MAG: ABC transporter permease [Candidatus Aminicenantes bacterium]|nr:MAG: ABC transporter permease [Candidatus Aminicenantes bacterium]